MIIALPFLLAFCSKNAGPAGEEAKKEHVSRMFTVTFENHMEFFDDSMFPAGSIDLPVSVNTVQQDIDLYLIGKRIYSFSPAKRSIRYLLDEEPNASDIIYGDYSRIMLFGNSLILKDAYRQENLLKTDVPLTGMWKNPFHNYVYVQDSSGYLYSIDYEHSILKRRVYTGHIDMLDFYKKGSRLFVSTDESYILLDYETLNVLFEDKKVYNRFAECHGINRIFMLNNSGLSIDLLNSVSFKNEGSINLSSPAMDMVSNGDSLLAIITDNGKRLSVFRSKKLIKDTTTTDIMNNILAFSDDDMLIKSDTILYHYNVSNGTVSILTSGKHLIGVSVFSSEEPDIDDIFVEHADMEEDNMLPETFYSVQIYSVDNKSGAQGLVTDNARKLKSEDVFFKEAVVSGKTYYRVYAGVFTDRADADKYRESLITKGYSDDILVIKLNR